MTAEILLACVSTICATWAVALARKSMKAIVTLSCWLDKRNGRLVVRASCRNDAQRAITVDAIRAPLTIWGRSAYVHQNFASRTLLVLSELFDPVVQYVSDQVIVYDDSPDYGARTISDGRRITASVDFENLVQSFERSGETLCDKLIVLIFLSTFHMQAHLSNGIVVKTRLGIADRLELLRLYWNDERLLR